VKSGSLLAAYNVDNNLLTQIERKPYNKTIVLVKTMTDVFSISITMHLHV